MSDAPSPRIFIELTPEEADDLQQIFSLASSALGADIASFATALAQLRIKYLFEQSALLGLQSKVFSTTEDGRAMLAAIGIEVQ